ncbi:unnamed protein product [Leptidea sinapis]|uniref:Uncharacterized protein n=1 Tax=Leptidea sinapis TaxID=189913 RepID=A0A5E4R0S0_9NEOP|nr:unnamed protein product [Leptidea sinapis]
MYCSSLLKHRKCMNMSLLRYFMSSRPVVSEVLTAYLKQCNEPPWTSYFVKYKSVCNDQFGMSNFNWKVGSSNYQILRTGCFPYIKYHCSKKEEEDLSSSDRFMRFIKVANLGKLSAYHVYFMV